MIFEEIIGSKPTRNQDFIYNGGVNRDFWLERANGKTVVIAAMAINNLMAGHDVAVHVQNNQERLRFRSYVSKTLTKLSSPSLAANLAVGTPDVIRQYAHRCIMLKDMVNDGGQIDHYIDRFPVVGTGLASTPQLRVVKNYYAINDARW